MKKVTPKDDRLTRIIDTIKNHNLYEKLVRVTDKDFKKRKRKKSD
jgi:hypothetical protein